MIQIIQPQSQYAPFYELVYKYTIGQHSGKTQEFADISDDNPFLERFVTLLNKMEPPQGHWGYTLSTDRLTKILDEGQITQDDYNFLVRTLRLEDNGYFQSEKDNDWADEFSAGDVIRSEFDGSFITFDGVDLYYMDDLGRRLNTKIIPDDTQRTS